MESGPLDQDLPFAIKAVVDTNVLIHGRNLADLPWKELADTEVEIVLVRQVIREIDNLKTRPGRIGKLGRGANTLIRELLTLPHYTKTLRSADPLVRVRIDVGAQSSTVRESLDSVNGDHVILSQALSLQEAGGRIIFVTNDNVAALTAMEHGVSYHLMTDAWLRPAEADEKERELTRTKSELERYKAAEPVPELWFENSRGDRLGRLEVDMAVYLPMEHAIVDALVDRVILAEPRQELKPSIIPESPPPGPGPLDISKIMVLRDESGEPIRPVTAKMIENYHEAYDDWVAEVRRQLAELHIIQNHRRSWPRLNVMARNVGTRPAKDMLIEIEAQGQLSLQSKDITIKTGNLPDRLLLPSAPAYPRTSSYRSQLLTSMFDHRDRITPVLPRLAEQRRDPATFYWRTKRDRASARMALECENWRHQREAAPFPIELRSLSDKDCKGAIVARISAGNLTDPVERTLPIKITFKRSDVATVAEKMVELFEAGKRSATLKRTATD